MSNVHYVFNKLFHIYNDKQMRAARELQRDVKRGGCVRGGGVPPSQG